MKKLPFLILTLLFVCVPLMSYAQVITPAEGSDIFEYAELDGLCVPTQKGQKIRYIPAEESIDGDNTIYSKKSKPSRADYVAGPDGKTEFITAKKAFNKLRRSCNKHSAQANKQTGKKKKKKKKKKKEASKKKKKVKKGKKGKKGAQPGNGGGASNKLLSSLSELEPLSAAFSSRAAADTEGPFINMVNLSKIGGAEAIFFNDFDSTVSTLSSGSPSQAACEALRGSNTDGDQGGLIGCYGAEDSLYPVETWLEAGKELCYISQIGDTRALKSGVIRPVSGKIGKLTELLQNPKFASRTIKFIVNHPTDGESSLFVKMLAQSDRDEGNIFQANTWTCSDDTSSPFRYANVSINSENNLDIRFAQDSDTKYDINFSASLISGEEEGEVNFDDSVDKTLSVLYSGTGTFKSISVIGDTLTTRMYRGGENTRQTLTVADFSAESAERVLLPSYAVRSQYGDGIDEVSRGIEFRRVLYMSAPDASNAVDALSFSEAFFETAPNTSEITTDIYSCSESADITVRLDLTGSDDYTLGIIEDCDTSIPTDTDFCSGDAEVLAAENAYIDNC